MSWSKDDVYDEAYKQTRELLNKIGGKNEFGDERFEFILIDRTTHTRLHYHPVRYSHNVDSNGKYKEIPATSEEWAEVIRTAKMNMSMATQDLDLYLTLWEDQRRKEQK